MERAQTNSGSDRKPCYRYAGSSFGCLCSRNPFLIMQAVLSLLKMIRFTSGDGSEVLCFIHFTHSIAHSQITILFKSLRFSNDIRTGVQSVTPPCACLSVTNLALSYCACTVIKKRIRARCLRLCVASSSVKYQYLDG